MSSSTELSPIWAPSKERVARANLSRFMQEHASVCADYAALYAWSLEQPEEFWPAVWGFCGIIAEDRRGRPWDAVLVGGDRMAPPDPMQGPKWFPGARLNFAENLLRRRDG